jgi:hypothetical protein
MTPSLYDPELDGDVGERLAVGVDDANDKWLRQLCPRDGTLFVAAHDRDRGRGTGTPWSGWVIAAGGEQHDGGEKRRRITTREGGHGILQEDVTHTPCHRHPDL